VNLRIFGQPCEFYIYGLQIVGGLAALLNVSLPITFTDFTKFLMIFKFDFTATLGVGCFTDGSYLVSLVVNFALVMAVALLVGVVYTCQILWLIWHPPDAQNLKGKERLQKIFLRFDPDNNGMDLAEIRAMMEKIDPSVSVEATAAIFKRADTDGSGAIDFHEFCDAITSATAMMNVRKSFRLNDGSDGTKQAEEVFQKLDTNGDGVIDTSEMKAALEQMDLSIGAEDALAIFKNADTNKDGSVDIDEFHVAVARSAMDLRVLAEKAERADITAGLYGRLFLLGFLLYPGDSVHARLFSSTCTPESGVLNVGLTANIFEVFMCRELGLNESVLHIDYTVDCEATAALRWAIGGVLVRHAGPGSSL
jgi:Ca2+-binding EF-hand superfamily protein